jgi:hypothetical protein
MFSKKTKKDKTKGQSPEMLELRQMLRDAIDRNSAIGIVRLGHSGQDPLAQGRLLEWDEKGLVIEQLQIIGRDVRFTLGSRIEAFVKFRETTLVFEAEVTEIAHASQLNEKQYVRSLRLSAPRLLRRGDRRSAFRSSVNGNGEEIPVRMWFLDRMEEDTNDNITGREKTHIYYTDLIAARRKDRLVPIDEEGNEPREIDWNTVRDQAQADAPHAIGRLVDLTANGLGILMYGVAKMQLSRFERIVVQFDLEDQTLDLIVEVRHGVDLKGSTCRVGTLIAHPHIGNMHAPQRRVLEKVAMEIQREQLRLRRSA